jgi:hypothetical protein
LDGTNSIGAETNATPHRWHSMSRVVPVLLSLIPLAFVVTACVIAP